MITVYIWKPRFGISQLPESQSPKKGITKAAMSGGNVGHVSLEVTIFENESNLDDIREQYSALAFNNAMPAYERVATYKSLDVDQNMYARGKW